MLLIDVVVLARNDIDVMDVPVRILLAVLALPLFRVKLVLLIWLGF